MVSEIKRSSYPIGVFDSGVGGLTVLQELNRQLPHESVVYFGDTARLPYGKRTQTEIIEFVQQILVWMQSQQVKMVIMACNTSSALALDALRQEFDFPILGVILPGARAAVKKGRRIGVIATTATVNSEAYVQAISESLAEMQSHAQIWQVACPEFVPLIESNRINDPYTLEVAREYLTPMLAADIDTLVFGCTHYPHLADVFRQILPAHVRFVDPAVSVVRAAAKELEILGLRHTDPRSAISRDLTKFYVSGDPEQFAQISSRWLNKMPTVEKVVLSPVELLS
ncbi:glutamate racemase [Pseudanabaena sp. PCC 6802]|uniref:glutamate racemase n=1 Tax=Pseudanabaena sp. PCC 6802 TaxID=118173 RepID=UPI0003640FC9|nr:glutamate racemase [Pseudanabaena sp. PCC 6802]